MKDDQLFMMTLVAIIIFFIINIFFSISLYKALKRVPPEKLLFPAWFAWMFYVPVAGYVFYWLVLPFGVPRSFRQALPNNPEAQSRAGTLFGLGLTFCIFLTVSLIPYALAVVGLPWLIIWIIYWAKVVKFRKMYLMDLKA